MKWDKEDNKLWTIHSARFTFARALGQADIKGLSVKIEACEPHGVGSKGPGRVQGKALVESRRKKPQEAVEIYGILSAKSLPKLVLLLLFVFLSSLLFSSHNLPAPPPRFQGPTVTVVNPAQTIHMIMIFVPPNGFLNARM